VRKYESVSLSIINAFGGLVFWPLAFLEVIAAPSTVLYYEVVVVVVTNIVSVLCQTHPR